MNALARKQEAPVSKPAIAVEAAAGADKKTERCAEKLARRERNKDIIAMWLDCHSLAEVAAAFGMRKSTVQKILAQAINPGRVGSTRRVGADVSRHAFGVVDKLAKTASVPRSTMIKRIVEGVCADEESARKCLGKLAIPVRSYRREVR